MSASAFVLALAMGTNPFLPALVSVQECGGGGGDDDDDDEGANCVRDVPPNDDEEDSGLFRAQEEAESAGSLTRKRRGRRMGSGERLVAIWARGYGKERMRFAFGARGGGERERRRRAGMGRSDFRFPISDFR